MSRFILIELDTDPDPVPDHRPLGVSGDFLTGSYSPLDVADFATAEAAKQAGERAPNRRAGFTLWVPGERKAA